ncbi:MAG: Asp-tRNA(Asn)/Glu-tRNA(Gln) amidotransferase subunit GatB [Candidatus Woesearchaeota archaeon]
MTQNKFTSETVIGLEIHIELDTDTKLFCGCSTENPEEPNTHTCPVCLGHPGSKPVLNRKAVDYALRLCLALGCELNKQLIFSRKSYFYPDMAKNYQTTQYELPLGRGGKLSIGDTEKSKEIGIVRVHIEEDPASLVHPSGMTTSPFVLVDYNRSGRPLCEVVTEPELSGPEEARDFMKKLITVLRYIGIFDQENCIIKADANLSVKETGYVRSEVKNITGFKEIERALKYEVGRHRKAASEGKKLTQDTRAWDAEKGVTSRIRVKETEEDYGYILDPDLVVVDITEDWLGKVKEEMPELAQDKIQKFIKDYGIDKIDAEVIAQHRELAELFEEIAKKADPVLSARWLRRELMRVMNYNEMSFDDLPVGAGELTELFLMIQANDITENVAKRIMEKFMEGSFSPRKYVEEQGLKVMSDKGELEKFCTEAVKENPKAVEEYKAGNEKSFNFLVGQVMRNTKGQAEPKEVNELLKRIIG